MTAPRIESFRFDVLDAANQEVRPVKVDPGAAIAARMALITRSITGVHLNATETALFDPYTERLQVTVVRDGTETTIGPFIPTHARWTDTPAGRTLDLQAHDVGCLMERPLVDSFDANEGTLVTESLSSLFAAVGLFGADIAASTAITAAHLAWPSRTQGVTYTTVAHDLVKLASFAPPRVSRTGQPIVEYLAAIGATDPVKEWDAGEATELASTQGEAVDLFATPNRFTVASIRDGALFHGVHDLGASHPLSASRRGLVIEAPEVDMPGLTSTAAADLAARDLAMRRRNGRTVTVSVRRPDPELEPGTVATYAETGWLIDGFDLVCQVGASQTVTLRESMVAV